ncbi:MAG: GIY-YIG nuclease family protein [Flavobacteriales bacterium]|nr:GIY-YIG nuclease family protein [Flavobacteriales bacterium]
MNTFFTYILYSKKLEKYYVGQSSDLFQRIENHNSGLSKFTKNGIPWTLIWSTELPSRQEALILEKKIKNMGAKRFLENR